MIKLAIGIPAYGGKVVSSHSLMWFRLGTAVIKSYEEETCDVCAFGTVDTCGIDNARNALLDVAKTAKADWLLMIDADTWVTNARRLLNMVILADKLGASLVGAPVMVRGGVNEWNVKTYDPKIDRYITCDPLSIMQPLKSLCECDAIGAAIMAIKISDIGDLRFRSLPSRSEDLDFCHRLKQEMGKKIFVDYDLMTYHLDKPNVLAYGREL